MNAAAGLPGAVPVITNQPPMGGMAGQPTAVLVSTNPMDWFAGLPLLIATPHEKKYNHDFHNSDNNDRVEPGKWTITTNTGMQVFTARSIETQGCCKNTLEMQIMGNNLEFMRVERYYQFCGDERSTIYINNEIVATVVPERKVQCCSHRYLIKDPHDQMMHTIDARQSNIGSGTSRLRQKFTINESDGGTPTGADILVGFGEYDYSLVQESSHSH